MSDKDIQDIGITEGRDGVTYNSPTKGNITFFVDIGKHVLTLTADGHIEAGAGLTMDETARGFLEAVNKNLGWPWPKP